MLHQLSSSARIFRKKKRLFCSYGVILPFGYINDKLSRSRRERVYLSSSAGREIPILDPIRPNLSLILTKRQYLITCTRNCYLIIYKYKISPRCICQMLPIVCILGAKLMYAVVVWSPEHYINCYRNLPIRMHLWISTRDPNLRRPCC